MAVGSNPISVSRGTHFYSPSVTTEKNAKKLWQSGVEKVRQDLIRLINENFREKEGVERAEKKYNLHTAEEYTQKISELAPKMLELIKKVGADTSLHASDALSRGDEALAQTFFELGTADRTKVAGTLAFAGECIEQVKKLLDQGADPVQTLVPIVLALEGKWAEKEAALQLLTEYSPLKGDQSAQLTQKYREEAKAIAAYAVGPNAVYVADSGVVHETVPSGRFLDAIAIHAAKHGHIGFAVKLLPHAQDPARIDRECLKYGFKVLTKLSLSVSVLAKLGLSVQAEKKTSSWKLSVILAQFTAVFRGLLDWIKHQTNLVSKSSPEESGPQELELKEFSRAKEIPHVVKARPVEEVSKQTLPIAVEVVSVSKKLSAIAVETLRVPLTKVDISRTEIAHEEVIPHVASAA